MLKSPFEYEIKCEEAVPEISCNVSLANRIPSLITFPCSEARRPMVRDWQNLTEQVPHEQGSHFGIQLGERNGLLVIDCDVLNATDNPDQLLDGVKAWKSWTALHGNVAAPHVRTPSGGLHVYFAFAPQIAENIRAFDGITVDLKSSGKRVKIDVLNSSRFVVGPGSPGYTWLTDEDAHRFISPMPRWLQEIITGDRQCVSRKRRSLTSEAQTGTAKRANKTRPALEGGDYISVNALQTTLSQVDPAFVDAYDDWTRVLWAIHETAKSNGYDAIDLAVEFSKRCPGKFSSEEDVREKYEESNGSLSYSYLLDISRYKKSGLAHFLNLLQGLLPWCPPTKVNWIQRKAADDSVLVVSITDEKSGEQLLRVLTDVGAVVMNASEDPEFFLAKQLRLNAQLDVIHPAFKHGCDCIFMQNDCFRLQQGGSDGEQNVKVELVMPLESKKSLLRLPCGKILRSPHKIQHIVDAISRASRLYIRECTGMSIRIYNKHSRSIAKEIDKMETNDEVNVRTMYILVLDFLRSLPELNQTYRFVHGQGVFYCDPKTNVWRIVSNHFFDFQLMALIHKHVRLTKREAEIVQENMTYVEQFRRFICGAVNDNDLVEKLDSNPDLFALNNCVLDFSRADKCLRQTVWSDFVQTSSGWSYDVELSRKHMHEVQIFFEQVMPKMDERKFLLYFFSRLLCGRHDGKQFLVLTDNRAGNNGKSTLMNLFLKVFGKYATTSSKYVCQCSIVADKNAHDAGLLALKRKRLIVCRELKRHNVLDCCCLNAVFGGQEVSGHQMYSPNDLNNEFHGACVYMLNEHDVVKLDFSDELLMQRMIVVPFRSKFLFVHDIETQEACKRQRNKVAKPQETSPRASAIRELQAPNTAIAKLDLTRQFSAWRSAVIDILREQFNQPCAVPESMERWRNEIFAKNDEVMRWLDEHFLSTGNSADFEVAATAFSATKYHFKPRPRPSQREMDAAWKRWAETRGFKFQKNFFPQINGQRKHFRNVVFGVQLVTDIGILRPVAESLCDEDIRVTERALGK